MVDTLSRYRLYSYGYTPPDVRRSTPTYRDLYHESAPFVFARRPTAHDCRMEAVKDNREKKDWEAWMFAKGMKDTYGSLRGLHTKVIKKTSGGATIPDKLLFDVGVRGSGLGDFSYPRGLGATLDGDILVADTDNNRIQVFNQFGLYKRKFGSKGNGKGQFDQPTGVAEMPNGDIAVADKNNRRIQVFTEKGKYKFEFPTLDPPYCIRCDHEFNTAISTTKRTIEVYSRQGKSMHSFSIGGRCKDKVGCQICVNNKGEIIVCDAVNNVVKFFKYDGRLLNKFEPQSDKDGIAMVPSAIGLSPLGDIIVCDALNHVANIYSERGVFVKQLICPTDEAGCIQACVVGPEGHFISIEFSVTGSHSLKIFRYLLCVCHLTRPGSSKRATPTQMD